MNRMNVAKMIWLIIGVSLAIHLLSFIVGNTILEDWKWAHVPFHSSIEMSGSAIALFVATFLIIFEYANRGTHFNMQIAAALIAMGLLDGFHAIVHEGNIFVWLHSLATFAGGILFITIFLPMRWKYFRSVKWPITILVIVLGIGSYSLLFPEILPDMVLQGKFSKTAMWLNISGGILLFISSFRLVREYYHTRNTDDLLFCLHCSLFGAAATMFEQSVIWDAPWWGWHILRFLAYLVALWFIVIAEKNIISDLLTETIERKKAEGELKALNESLEITVADRTLELVKSNEMLKQEIVERKRNEKERNTIQIKMMAASRLASLGEIATGIAHEINQPLTYISSFIQRFRHKLENNNIDGDELKHELQMSSTQISRIDNIIAHLRTFGRSDSALIQLVRIKKILDNTLLLMRERIRLNNIELSQDIEPDLPEIKGSQTGLEQVFINLLQNSLDAFPEKHKGAEIRIGVHLSEDRKQVIIKFSDNGIGIEKKVVDKMFEPFFTTKEVGKGTGIGLSIVYGIIKDHNGLIECKSEVNKGTLFTIKLPLY